MIKTTKPRSILPTLSIGFCVWLVGAANSVAVGSEATALNLALGRIEHLEQQVHQLRVQQSPNHTGPLRVIPASSSTPSPYSIDPTQGYDTYSPASSCCADIVPCGAPMQDYMVHSGWFAASEMLNLKVHQRGLDFAITEDGTALTLGEGRVHNLDYDRDIGFRKTIGFRTKTDWSVSFVYTTLETDGLAYAERPDGIGQLFSTRSQPGDAEEANSARFASDFDYQLFDLIAARPIYKNRFASVTAFGGLRWVDVRQKFQYDFQGRDFTNGQITDLTTMDGLGLRFGSQGQWHLSHGFSIVGSIAAGVTFGRFESSYYESNLDDTLVTTNVRDSYDQAVTNLEAQVGVSRCLFDRLTITGGYEMAQWFNLSDRALFTDHLQEATFAPIAQDVLLEGLFARAEFVW